MPASPPGCLSRLHAGQHHVWAQLPQKLGVEVVHRQPWGAAEGGEGGGRREGAAEGGRGEGGGRGAAEGGGGGGGGRREGAAEGGEGGGRREGAAEGGEGGGRREGAAEGGEGGGRREGAAEGGEGGGRREGAGRASGHERCGKPVCGMLLGSLLAGVQRIVSAMTCPAARPPPPPPPCAPYSSSGTASAAPRCDISRTAAALALCRQREGVRASMIMHGSRTVPPVCRGDARVADANTLFTLLPR